MGRNMDPILKTCRALDISPAYVGIFKESIRAPKVQRRTKMSEYGLQLREKQRVKFVYGLQERQLQLTFEKAKKLKGLAGENLLSLLERRLDSILFRLTIGTTRRQSRQIVTHGHVRVNGKRVDIPSYRAKVGDVIDMMEGSRNSDFFKGFKEEGRAVPAWLSLDRETLTATILRLPERADVDLPVDETMIAEWYSR